MRPPVKVIRSHHEQARLFRALGHPARIAILSTLRDGEQCVCHMEAKLGLRQSAISQHLMVLRAAGLVEDRRDGWNVYYRRTRSFRATLSGALKLIESSGPSGPVPEHAAGACPCPKCSVKHQEQVASIPAGRGVGHD